LREVRGENDAVVFARSATVGGQQFPVHWGGDSTATFESMAETLRGGLSLGLSGFGFWSHDIGGFEQTANADVYKRWIAFGLLSSHSRLHGSNSYRVPWAYDEEAVDVLRKFTKLKCSLMPYLYQVARQAHEKGIPMLRAMFLEFPDDPTCDYLDRQYMLGDSLLVAPIFSRDGNVDYYVPSGVWTNLLNGDSVEGPRWIREKHDVLSLPLLVRPNTILPMSNRTDRPDYEYSQDVILKVFHFENGNQARVEIPDLIGDLDAVFEAQREEDLIRIQRQGSSKPWKVLLVNVHSIESDQPSEATSEGMLISLDSPINLLEVKVLP
jgi:alpha-D-xyloside xylohydrolase